MTYNPVSTIATKRDGGILAPEEIATFIDGFTAGSVPEYQMSALAMAIYLRGMNASETAALTDRMLRSGTILSWPEDAPPIVDKHSTGGIGDKVSLVLAPLLACCGLWVPMISGRGLGPTGGTLDKLEAIPGFRTNLSLDEIRAAVTRVGCVITGASAEIAPADKKLYALRDVTATVASIPLITASIMSKKLAEGLDSLVLDVKWGSGAFMKSLDDARKLARSMVATGQRMNVATTAVLTDMNQPLGRMAGNAVEVLESLDALAGRGPADLMDVTLALGAELLVSTNLAASIGEGRAQLQRQIDSGAGREKFEAMVAAQGGSLAGPLRVAPATEFTATCDGFISRIDTERLGWAVIDLGGGRRVLSDQLDLTVGLEMLVRIGDRVERRQPLVRLFASSDRLAVAREHLEAAITLSDESPQCPALIVERLGRWSFHDQIELSGAIHGSG